MTSSEFWFPVGAVALYLYDSIALLWQNELVYLRAGRCWRVDGGMELRLRGRRVFLPNPLLPHRPQFLVCWSKAESAGQACDEPQRLLCALRPIAWLNLLQVLLIASLPLLLWVMKAVLLAVLAIGLYYLATLSALVIAWLRRGALGLAPRAFWSLALDVLACAPFAANMTRRLSQRHGLSGEPLRFASRHFDDAALAHTRALVEARVREEYAAPERSGHGEEILLRLLPRLAR